MEQVINAQERKYAFVKFLFFFAITVAIIIAAVYFNTLIPGNENEVLRKRIASYENQAYTQEQFVAVVEEVKSLIDSSIRIGKVNALLDREIAKQLNLMNSPQFQDSSIYARQNKDMFLILYEYSEMNKKFMQADDALQEVENLKSELSICERRLEVANSSLDVYRNGANLDVGR